MTTQQPRPTLLMRWSLLGTIANRGISICSIVLLARIVGIGSFGVWALAVTTAGLVASVANLGMHLDAQRAVNGLAVNPDGRRRVWLVMRAICITGLGGGLLGGWITAGFEVADRIPSSTWIAVIAVIGIGLASNNFAHCLLIARERVATAFIATDGLRNALVVVVMYWISASAEHLLWVYAFASIGVSLTAWLLLAAMEPRTLFGSQSSLPFITAIRSGTGVLTVSVVFYMRRQGDVLILGALLSDIHYAIYFAAARLANVVALGLASLSASLGPRIGAQFIDKRLDDAQHTISTVTSRSAVLAAITLVVLVAAGGELLQVFGTEFRAGYWVLIALSAGLLVQALAGPTGMILQFCGQAWRCARIEGLSAMIGLPMLCVATLWGGINGAAVISGGITVLCCVFEARAIARTLKLKSWLQVRQ